MPAKAADSGNFAAAARPLRSTDKFFGGPSVTLLPPIHNDLGDEMKTSDTARDTSPVRSQGTIPFRTAAALMTALLLQACGGGDYGVAEDATSAVQAVSSSGTHHRDALAIHTLSARPDA